MRNVGLALSGLVLACGLSCNSVSRNNHPPMQCSSQSCERRVEEPKKSFNPKNYYWEDFQNVKVFLRDLHWKFADLRKQNFYTTSKQDFGRFSKRTSSFNYGDEIWVVVNFDKRQLQRFKGDLVRVEYHDEYNTLRSNSAFYVGGLNKVPVLRIRTSNYSYKDISNGYQKVHLKIGPDGQEVSSAGVLLFKVD